MSASGATITSKTVDLTNCDREQIQFVAAIQPHGALLVLQEPELLILQASRNTASLLGISAETLVGSNLRSLFSEEQFLTLRELLLRSNPDGPPLHVMRGQFCGRNFDVLAHRCSRSLILEFEVRNEDAGAAKFDLYAGLHNAISRIEATENLQSFLDLAAREIRYLTEFDRVVIYKFMEDKSGWVRSESLREGIESYLNLHYPASDIPEPARRLFSLTWVRHQPDIAYTAVPIFPENNPLTDRPLDMSYALLRSVSIMYIDYLKNMGTRASLVMTLLKGGELWGLVACHHHTGPKHVPYEVRAACEFLAHTVSLLMAAKEDLENHQYRMSLKATRRLMTENIARRGDFTSCFIQDSPNLSNFIKAGGTSIIINGDIASLGDAPSRTEIKQIVQWLSNAMSEPVFATNCLSAYLPEAAAFKDVSAGLLALRFYETKSDFILWFRPEIVHTVNWAGDPHKPMDLSSDWQRLLPRTSFALWKETVRFKSAPWSEVELEAVNELRTALLELVFRRAELGRLYADLKRHAELDSFAYVASHDLKEPLRGISNYAEMLCNDYADKLDEAAKVKLATINRLCRRMGELLDSLHEYSRLGEAESSQSDVDLNTVVSQALDLLQVHIQAGDILVRIPRPLPTVKGDRMSLVQVFMNLISNAIKYNDKSKKEVEISFETSTLVDQPVFSVQDNGIGIAEQHFEQIFLVFRRLHAVDEFGGGAGAGLTIIRKMIQRVGGRIWLKSILGQGSTFYFTLGSDASLGKHS